MIWIVLGPVMCFILLLFVGGAIFVILKKKYDLSLLSLMVLRVEFEQLAVFLRPKRPQDCSNKFSCPNST